MGHIEDLIDHSSPLGSAMRYTPPDANAGQGADLTTQPAALGDTLHTTHPTPASSTLQVPDVAPTDHKAAAATAVVGSGPAPAVGVSTVETSNAGTPPLTLIIAVDTTRIGAAFARLCAALAESMKPSLQAWARLAAHYRAQLSIQPRRHRTFRRIVRAPRPPRPRSLRAAPSALNAAYTRRYRNRQGHR